MALRGAAGVVGAAAALAAVPFWLTTLLAIPLVVLPSVGAIVTGDVGAEWWRDVGSMLWIVGLPVLLAVAFTATAVSGLVIARRGWPQTTRSRQAVVAAVAAGIAGVVWLVFAFGPPLPRPQDDQVVGRAIRGPGDDMFSLVTWPHGYGPIGFTTDRVVAIPHQHAATLVREAGEPPDETGYLWASFSVSRDRLEELDVREAVVDGRVFTLDDLQPGAHFICLGRSHPDRVSLNGCQVTHLEVPGRIDIRLRHGRFGVTVRH